MKVFVTAFLLTMLVTLPLFARASVQITEIMYDLPGTDSKHEWIEIKNDGAPVDLSAWKLYEGGSNHGLAAYTGNGTVPSGSYAVIADDPVTFLSDYPGFSGILFDVALSGGLNNTDGETLTLRDADLVDVDAVTYSPATGAQGDGNSLHLVSGVWRAFLPTPGAAPSSESAPPMESTGSAQTATTLQTSPAASQKNEAENTHLEVSAGGSRTLSTGAAAAFKAVAIGLQGKPIENARFVWNFGNGDSKEGASLLYTYSLPGTYAVTLNASSGKLTGTDRITVTVTTADVAITKVTPEFVEVTNRASQELDVGFWHLESNGALFMFPEHTLILPQSSIAIPHAVSALGGATEETITLLYPNGVRAAGFEAPPVVFAQYAYEPRVQEALPPTASAAIQEETAVEKREDTAETIPNASLIAAAAAVQESAPNDAWFWYVACGVVVLAALSATFWIRTRNPRLEKAEKLSDET